MELAIQVHYSLHLAAEHDVTEIYMGAGFSKVLYKQTFTYFKLDGKWKMENHCYFSYLAEGLRFSRDVAIYISSDISVTV